MKRYFLVTMIVLSVYACNNSYKNEFDETYFEEIGDTTFQEFYKKFYTDSLYQIKHVKFPLEGAYHEYGREKEWKKKQWVHKKEYPFTLDSMMYFVNLEKDKKRIIENIQLKESGFSLQFQYEKIDGRWFLVYYDEFNF